MSASRWRRGLAREHDFNMGGFVSKSAIASGAKGPAAIARSVLLWQRDGLPRILHLKTGATV